MIYTLAVTTTGSNGSATGSAQTAQVVMGEVAGVVLTYHASAPNTTDVTIKEVGGLGRTLLTVSNSATSTTVYPQATAVNASNTAITNSHLPYFVESAYLLVEVADSNALTPAVTVQIQTRA